MGNKKIPSASIIGQLSLAVILLLVLACTSSEPKQPEEQVAVQEDQVPMEAAAQEKIARPPVQQEKGKLTPVDEGKLSPDFDRFRQEVLAAIGRKDVKFMEQIVSEDIKIGFGGDDGRAAFMEHWKLNESPKNSELWQELKRVLVLGGTFDRSNKDAFMAPYPSSLWPEDYDAFEYAVIVGEGVRLRAEPSSTAEVVGSGNYDIVKLISETGTWEKEMLDGEEWYWRKIELSNKTQGYIYGKYLCGPVDYRAYFERKEGRWGMVSFLAGD